MIGTLPGCFVSEKAESQRQSAEPSENSGPQVRAGLNFLFLHGAPTMTDSGVSAADLATARSLLPLLTFHHHQPSPAPGPSAISKCPLLPAF